MYFIYDFDGTLFSMKPLSHAWLGELIALGCSPEDVERTRAETVKAGYTFREHGSRLGVPETVLEPLVQAYLLRMERESPDLLFWDARAFLHANAPENRQVLLTYGNPDFQEIKIRATGIREYLDAVHVAGPHRPKLEHMQEIVSSHTGPFVYFEDNAKELLRIHEAGMPVTLIRICRPDQFHSETHALDGVAWQCVESFTDVDIRFLPTPVLQTRSAEDRA